MSNALFCHWGPGSGDFPAVDLSEVTDLHGFKYVFLDPLNFAVKNSLRRNTKEIWIKEFIPVVENDLRRYLGLVKPVIKQLHTFLAAGGTLVLRANFPNSIIQVRKKSIAGTSHFTDSVVEPFFWLNEFLGKYSVNYILERSIEYHNQAGPFARAFANVRINSWQSITNISHGTVTELAHASGHSGVPIITRVTFAEGGEIVFIPRFLDRAEGRKLVGVLEELSSGRPVVVNRPGWADQYTDQLTVSDPNSRSIAQIDEEIARLTRARASHTKSLEQSQEFCGLLYRPPEELVPPVRRVMELLSFYFVEPPPKIARAKFGWYMRDKQVKHIVGQVAGTATGPLPAETCVEFIEKINACRMRERPKGILVANADYMMAPALREEWFAAEAIETAEAAGICLLTTAQLFEIVCLLLRRTESETSDSVKLALRQEILECKGTFVFNRRRYFNEIEAATVAIIS